VEMIQGKSKIKLPPQYNCIKHEIASESVNFPKFNTTVLLTCNKYWQVETCRSGPRELSSIGRDNVLSNVGTMPIKFEKTFSVFRNTLFLVFKDLYRTHLS
jgi:hypothetical protein